ncbi:glycosyl transferase [Neorhizobium galegae]|uniref:glycosyl transferase n=1 Tax=Neorhizobium galegae TaxID=399 RepID=UPI001FCC2880|nr:glycosyl transferase [Neorhizobium galegae]
MNRHQASHDIIKARGFAVYGYDMSAEAGSWELELIRSLGSAKIWINDRLNTQPAHAKAVVAAGLKLVTFDDRGDGAALADLNISALVFEDIAELKGKDVRSGVEFMILNPEIELYRRHRDNLTSVLVTMGGADTYGVTIKVAQWLRDNSMCATIVTGPAFQHKGELDAILTDKTEGVLTHLGAVASLAQEMARHDLAITGGGVTPFEACAGGLPCIVIANEDFEIPVGWALEKLGCARFAGHHRTFDLAPVFEDLPIRTMSLAALDAVDLEGVRRVGGLIRRLEI